MPVDRLLSPPNPRRRSICLALLLGGGAATHAGCTGEPAGPGPTPVSVLYVGGSWASVALSGSAGAWPGRVTRALGARGLPTRGVNGSGANESGALAVARMPLRLRTRPEVVVIALGTSEPATSAELESLLVLARDAGADVLLVQPDAALDEVIGDLGRRYALPPPPALLAGLDPAVIAHADTLIAAQARMAENLLLPVETLVRARWEQRATTP